MMVPDFTTIIGAIGGGALVSGIAGFIGVRIGVAKLEVWREVTTASVSEHDKRIALVEDDSRVHDMELQLVLRKTGIERVSRQAIR